MEEMVRGGYNFGGEQSGHLVFLDHNTTGDGILTALQVLAVMRRQEKKLSELASIFKPLPQTLINVAVKQKKDPCGIPEFDSLLKKIQEKLSDRGRLLVRPSGTENLIRIMVEGEDGREIVAYAEEMAECIRRNLGD